MGLLFDLEDVEGLKGVFDVLLVLGAGTLLFSFFMKAVFGGYVGVTRMFFGLMSSVTAVTVLGDTFLLPNFVWFFLVTVSGSVFTRIVIFCVKNFSFSVFSGSEGLSGREYLDRHDIDSGASE